MPTIKELVQKEAESLEKAKRLKESVDRATSEMIEVSEKSTRSPTVA